LRIDENTVRRPIDGVLTADSLNGRAGRTAPARPFAQAWCKRRKAAIRKRWHRYAGPGKRMQSR
jgi:hypothetical protein